MNVLVLWNRAARLGHERALLFIEELGRAGLSALVFPGGDEPVCFGEVLRAHGGEADAVAVVGGDGTLNAALDGLLGRELPLVCVPAGTANNFARNLALPTDAEGIIEALRRLEVVRVDVAFVNETPFLTVCGIGLSCLVNESTPRTLKVLLGPLAFAVQFFRVLWRHRPFRVKLLFSDRPPLRLNGVTQITVCNGRHYALGLSVDEQARLDDGQIDVLCTHFRSWWRALFCWFSFWHGRTEHLSEVTHVRATAIEVVRPRGVRVDVDGDLKERTPARFRVRRACLPVVVKAEAKVTVA